MRISDWSSDVCSSDLTGAADLALQSGALLTTTANLGGANVSLQGDGGISLGADVTATGNLSLTSQDAAIVQTGGALSVGGGTTVDAGTGDVILAGANNDFTGAVDITGGSVTITDANALTLGTVTAGQLTATSTAPSTWAPPTCLARSWRTATAARSCRAGRCRSAARPRWTPARATSRWRTRAMTSRARWTSPAAPWRSPTRTR